MPYICHVISGYYRNDPRIFQRQCKSLRDTGYSVSILTNDGQEDEVLDGIPIYSCEKFYSSRLKVFAFATAQFYKRALQIDADAYQLHSPELVLLGLVLKLKNKKVVYDAHEDLPRHILEKHWISGLLRKPLSALVDLYFNIILRQYDAIVSPHHHVVDKMLTINPNSVLVTNFAKVEHYEDAGLHDYLQRENVICYSGTVYPHSNQKSIMDAISRIDGVKYKIAGLIPPDMHEFFSHHTAFGKLSFMGRLNWADLKAFYRTSIAGVVVIDYKLNLGSKKGTYAVNKMFEYMESGLPIICSDYELWKNVVDEYRCGFYVEPHNTEQLYKAIQYIIDNKEIAYQMGLNGRRAVEERYSWQIVEQDYVDVFDRMLKYAPNTGQGNTIS